MLTHRHFSLVLLTATVLFGIGLISHPTVVQGSSKYIVRSSTSIHHHTYKITKGALYSQRLGKKYGQVSHFKKTIWVATKKEQLQNSRTKKQDTYYYVVSSNRVHRGWINSRYLHKVKPAMVPKKSSKQPTKDETFNADTVDQDLFKMVNDARVKNGVTPYVYNSDLETKISKIRAHQIITHYSHYDAEGNAICDQLAIAAGLTDTGVGENLDQNFQQFTNYKTAKAIFDAYYYDDAASNWGHKENILDASSTDFSTYTVIKNGEVYNAMNFLFVSDHSTDSDNDDNETQETTIVYNPDYTPDDDTSD